MACAYENSSIVGRCLVHVGTPIWPANLLLGMTDYACQMVEKLINELADYLYKRILWALYFMLYGCLFVLDSIDSLDAKITGWLDTKAIDTNELCTKNAGIREAN